MSDDDDKTFDLVSTSITIDEKLIIIGSKERILPTELILDTAITGDELRLWTILRHLAASAEQNMPTQEELAGMINKSRPTVNLGLQLLRIDRWITVIQDDDRNRQGQFNQLTYAIHNYRMPISETVSLDPGYQQFLSDKSKGASKRLRLRAFDTLTEVHLSLHSNAQDKDKDLLSTSFQSGRQGLKIPDIPADNSAKYLQNSGDDTQRDNETINQSDSFDYLFGTSNQDTKHGEDINENDPVCDAKPVPIPSSAYDQNNHTEGANKITQWHELLKQLPKGLRPIVLRQVEKFSLTPEQVELALKTTLKRINNPKLKPIDILPKYIESMMKKAKSGELYNPDEARKETAKRKKDKSDKSIKSALNRRAMAVGLSQSDSESDKAFEERVNQAEYSKQMERLGQNVHNIR